MTAPDVSRYTPAEPIGRCDTCRDCGAIVADRAAHDRFHSILASHAWALAVLQVTHIAAHIHDRYEANDKINSKQFDNWSADALAEVVKDIDEQSAQ